MLFHFNAKTNVHMRAEIRDSELSVRALASHYRVSPSVVHSWKHREDLPDRSSRPHALRSAISEDAKCVALELRRKGLTLDECQEALLPVFPGVSRASLHRFYSSEGLGRLHVPQKRENKKFKSYEPGFLHVDTFNMPKLGGKKRYCFLAIDRATRMVLLKVYDSRSKHDAEDFLLSAIEFFPFKIHRALTDNGSEYTNHYYKGGTACKEHSFDLVCRLNSILHRLTGVRTPQTNGMAERMVRMAKEKALKPMRFDSHQQMEEALLAWCANYNCFRKHGSLGRKTPLDVALEWYKIKPEIFTRDPASMLEAFGTC
jgi:transposase InsO family protein